MGKYLSESNSIEPKNAIVLFSTACKSRRMLSLNFVCDFTTDVCHYGADEIYFELVNGISATISVKKRKLCRIKLKVPRINTR